MAEEAFILFHAEGIEFQLDTEDTIRRWLQRITQLEGVKHGDINFVFMSDDDLLAKNIEFLNHDYYTDIISFQMNDDPIEGDIFISIDRVKENALNFSSSFDTELRRVLAHGVLHFIGYGDKTADEAKQMRAKEDAYLALFVEQFELPKD